MQNTSEQIADLTRRIDGFEKLLVALKFSADADLDFKEKSKAVIPQVEDWLKANRMLLGSMAARA